MMADQLGDHVLGAAQQRRGAVAVVQLVRRGDAGHALVGGGDQRRRAFLRSVEAGDQRRGARLQRAADVGGRQVLLDVQRRADDAGILAILERMRRRGEVDVADVLGLVAGQAVARRLDRHGDRVLVPVGHRALALGEAAQAGGEPLVGVVDGLTVETKARHIGAIGHDSDHRSSSSTWSDLTPVHERAFMGSLLARSPGPGEPLFFMAALDSRNYLPVCGTPPGRRHFANEVAITGALRGCAGTSCRPSPRPRAGR